MRGLEYTVEFDPKVMGRIRTETELYLKGFSGTGLESMMPANHVHSSGFHPHQVREGIWVLVGNIAEFSIGRRLVACVKPWVCPWPYIHWTQCCFCVIPASD